MWWMCNITVSYFEDQWKWKLTDRKRNDSEVRLVAVKQGDWNSYTNSEAPNNQLITLMSQLWWMGCVINVCMCVYWFIMNMSVTGPIKRSVKTKAVRSRCCESNICTVKNSFVSLQNDFCSFIPLSLLLSTQVKTLCSTEDAAFKVRHQSSAFLCALCIIADMF